MSGGFTPSLRRSVDNVTAEASFLASEDYTVKRVGITLDASTVAADEAGDKVVKAGTFVAKITASGKYGPYGGLTNEVQTITEGGSGLTSFTLTWDGNTTASLDDQATAAQVQAALEALPNVDEGDVTVSGNPGGVYTVTFGGEYAGRNVSQMTATPTGGTGTVTIATTTAGGASVSDGRQTPGDTAGYTMESVNLKDGDVVCGVLLRGSVLEARVTPAPDATTKTAVKGRIFYQ